MGFRVAIIGPKHFTDYPTLRTALDALLARRLPDVQLLTCGGPGVALLAASYAAERGLSVAALIPEYGRYPEAAAVQRRDAELITLADAAVIVLTERDPDVRRLLELLQAKGEKVHIIGAAKPARVKPTAPPVEPETRRGLPD
jgi:hypothetical protein